MGPGTALAFDYEEHAAITQAALHRATADGPLPGLPELASYGGRDLCPDPSVWPQAGCLSFADLPALAGDHAGSPLLLKWRWLNSCANDVWVTQVGDYLAAGVAQVEERGCESPETTVSSVPDHRRFIRATRHPSRPATDDELGKADGSYVRAAGHGCAHFRKAGVRDSNAAKQAAIETYQYHLKGEAPCVPSGPCRRKPGLNAFAWYAQLHAGALELSQNPAPESRAAAWIFEFFSLHFLQDSVSAGHVDSPTTGGTGLATLKAHDAYNHTGLLVGLADSGICSLVDGSEAGPLAYACATGRRELRIYGDEYARVGSATFEIAARLSAVSLREVGQAIGASAGASADCVADQSHPAWTWTKSRGVCREDAEVYECLHAVWEGGGLAESLTTRMQQGQVKALALIPMPTSPPGGPPAVSCGRCSTPARGGAQAAASIFSCMMLLALGAVRRRTRD